MAAKDNDDRKQDADANEPMIDMSQAAVKKMIGDARERGYITYDQLNTVCRQTRCRLIKSKTSCRCCPKWAFR